jgi:hypothetical protein
VRARPRRAPSGQPRPKPAAPRQRSLGHNGSAP